MSEVIKVKVTVDTDELREWAARHADAGNHGVAHVLYKAAEDVESVSEQAMREVEAERDAALREVAKRDARLAKVEALHPTDRRWHSGSRQDEHRGCTTCWTDGPCATAAALANPGGGGQ